MKPGKPQVNAWLRYSGIAIQLFVLLAIGAWLGQKVDQWAGTSKPYFTILLILLFAAGFFYRLIKDLNES